MDTGKLFSALFTSVAAFVLFGVAGSADAQVPVSITPTRIEFAAPPGEVLKSTVKFWNGTDLWLPIQVGAEDFRPSDEEGHVVVEDAGSSHRSLKEWVRPEVSDIVVAPKENITLGFSLHVPHGAEPGSYWGALVVRTAPLASEGTTAVQVRIGTIMLLSVFGDVEERLAVERFSAPRLLDGPPVTLEAHFRNDGTVHLKPHGMIEVRNFLGSVAATSTLPEHNVLPGYARKIKATVGDGFWFGRYTATMSARYGMSGQELFAETTFWVVPWRSVGVPSAVLAVLFGFVILTRRRFKAAWHVLHRGEEREPEQPEPPVREKQPPERTTLEGNALGGEGRKPRKIDL